MKSCFVLLVGLAVVGANAQTNQARAPVAVTNVVHSATNAPGLAQAEEPVPEASRGPLSDEAFAARIIRNAGETTLIYNELKPNEITRGKLTFSGIGIEIVKMPNPLQLLNPFAPAEYGSGEINLVRDPGGHPSGLKFFSIQF